MVEVDEARLREDMRADLPAALDEQSGTVAALLYQRETAMIDAQLGALEERLRRRCVPARERRTWLCEQCTAGASRPVDASPDAGPNQAQIGSRRLLFAAG